MYPWISNHDTTTWIVVIYRHKQKRTFKSSVVICFSTEFVRLICRNAFNYSFYSIFCWLHCLVNRKLWHLAFLIFTNVVVLYVLLNSVIDMLWFFFTELFYLYPQLSMVHIQPSLWRQRMYLLNALLLIWQRLKLF